MEMFMLNEELPDGLHRTHNSYEHLLNQQTALYGRQKGRPDCSKGLGLRLSANLLHVSTFLATEPTQGVAISIGYNKVDLGNPIFHLSDISS